jgi:3-dehydroquinate dehydratase-2
MPKILILNGPNLNMLGLREPEIYGAQTLDEIKGACLEKAKEFNFEIDFRQTNHEGVLVDWIQEAAAGFDGLIINAAAYTHTSIALHDALKILKIPVVEVHLSDPKKREAFRHFSYVESVAKATISGRGGEGYALALAQIAALLTP